MKVDVAAPSACQMKRAFDQSHPDQTETSMNRALAVSKVLFSTSRSGFSGCDVYHHFRNGAFYDL